MYLHRNFSFNQRNISHKEKEIKKKINNIIRLKNNYNNQNKRSDNKLNVQKIEDDISFYDNIRTLKNQIFSPDNNEDIHLYNSNKNMEKKIKYEDEKNSNYNFKTSRSFKIKNINQENKSKIDNNKKTLILDLDETLVHSLFEPEKMNNIAIKPDIHLKIFFNNKYQEIFVYKRPFLDIFLKEMHKIFNIYVFTASIEKYAKPLLEKLDKNKLIIKKFYRESCLLSEGKFIKNLNSLNLNLKLKDIIIVDNNPFSFKFNKNNGIPIKSWHFDKSDCELIKIIPLLKYLSKTDDIRKYIPYIVKNDSINFEFINRIMKKQQKKIYKTINYNNNNKNDSKNNCVNNYHNPNTINFREPQKQKNQKIIIKNFNKKNNNINPNMIYRNDNNKNNCYKNSSICINFNSGDINNKDKFFKSYNNFYIKSKYSFVINQEKENEKNCETNLNNLINKHKEKNIKNNQKIPFDNKILNKINNKTSRIYKEHKTLRNDINSMIRHCSSYKNIINEENNKNNSIKALINMNNDYIQLKNNNTIETALEQNKFKKNIEYNRSNSYSHKTIDKNNPYLNNLIRQNNKEAFRENNGTIYDNQKQKIERFVKNSFAKRKMRLKNILYRNNLLKYNQNMKSYSYSNFGREKIKS